MHQPHSVDKQESSSYIGSFMREDHLYNLLSFCKTQKILEKHPDINLNHLLNFEVAADIDLFLSSCAKDNFIRKVKDAGFISKLQAAIAAVLETKIVILLTICPKSLDI